MRVLQKTHSGFETPHNKHKTRIVKSEFQNPHYSHKTRIIDLKPAFQNPQI